MGDSDPRHDFVLGDVASVTVGGTPSTEVPALWGGDVPWMASGDVHRRRITDVPGRISALGLRSSSAAVVSPPSVAIALAGQGKTRGTAALVQCDLCTNQSVALISGDGKHLLTSYLFHDLDRRYEELRARSSGGGRGGLSKTILESIPLLLPPVQEQAFISQILDTVDDSISSTESVIAKLQHLTRGLLHDLLARGIDENGDLRDPVRRPDQFRKTPSGSVPTSWTVSPFRSLCHRITYGFTNPMPTAASGPWMLTAADIGYGSVNLAAARHTSELAFERYLSDKSRPQRGDVLITKDGTLGRVARLDLDRVCVNQSVAVARPNAGVATKFLIHYLLSPSGQEAMLSDAGGSTIKHLYISKLGSLQIPVPPKPEADQIVVVIEQAQARLDREIQLLDKLRALKTGLMNDLLTGRVRVNLSDGSAS